MDLALITAQQVAELFILMGLGALGAKTGLLRPEGKQTLSNLLVNLVVPAMIINSYRMDFSPEILRNLLAAFALSILSSLLGLVITLLFTARSKDSRTPIFRFACVFSNAGYMGLPLISALFGSEGLLYASAYFTIFNLLLWTLGYSIVSGSSDPKKVAGSLLRCPAIYAIVVGLVLYLFQIPLPTLITQPMELLGDMNTPLSMLITGMLIASGDLRRILTDKHIWELTVIRMFFIPVLTIAAFAALGLFRYGMATQVVLLLECCPAAAITSVFAVQFRHDEQFAAGSVVLTTLLSILFLPGEIFPQRSKNHVRYYHPQRRLSRRAPHSGDLCLLRRAHGHHLRVRCAVTGRVRGPDAGHHAEVPLPRHRAGRPHRGLRLRPRFRGPRGLRLGR